MDAGNDLLIKSSALSTTQGDATLTAGRDVTIISEAEKYQNKTSEENKTFSGLELSSTRSSVTAGVGYIGTKQTTQQNEQQQKAADIQVNGDFTITAKRNATVLGSNIEAEDNVTIKGAESTIIGTAANTAALTNTSASTKDLIGITVGNSWLETAYQLGDAIGSATTQDFTRNEGRVNAAVSAAQTYVASVQAAQIVNSIASSAESAATLGFYGSITATHKEQETRSDTNTSTAQGSNIISRSGNIQLGEQGGNATSIVGSNVTADNGNITLSGKQVNIEAGENTNQSEQSSRDTSITQTLASTAPSQMALPTYSQNNSSNQANGTTYTNSQIQAKNGTFKVEAENADIEGANITAKKVDLTEVEKTITVASKQDTATSQGSSLGYSVGNSNGINSSSSESSSKWTNNQTTIIGTEEIQIKADTLKNTGAVIANQKADGSDGGNLNINVNHLEVTDLQDKATSQQQGGGISTSLTTLNTPTREGQTTIQLSNGGTNKEGTTSAAFGQGKIIVQNDITVNGNTTAATNADATNTALAEHRDTNKTQITTKDETSGGLNVNLTANNKDYLNPVKAVEEGNKELSAVPENAPKAYKNAVDMADATIKDAQGEVDIVVSNLTGKDPKASSLIDNRDMTIEADKNVRVIPNDATADFSGMNSLMNMLSQLSMDKSLSQVNVETNEAAKQLPGKAGDLVQAVPAPVYDMAAIATIPWPMVSFGISVLGTTKTVLDYQDTKDNIDLTSSMIFQSSGLIPKMPVAGQIILSTPGLVYDIYNSIKEEKDDKNDKSN